MKKYSVFIVSLSILMALIVYFVLKSPKYEDLSSLMDSANSFDISKDGKTVIVLSNDYKIFQLKLKTAWNFNSIDYKSIKSSKIQDNEIAVSINYSRDGRKLFLTRKGVSSSNKNNYRNGYIQQFTMSKPFDLTTLDNGDVFVECKCSFPAGLSFDETGQYMQVVGLVATQFFYYHLELPYNIRTAKYLGLSFISRSINGLGHASLSKATQGIYYTTEVTTNSAYQFKMVTDGNYPELKYDYKQLDLSHLESMPTNIIAHPNGKKIFILSENARIYTYQLENNFNLNSELSRPVF